MKTLKTLMIVAFTIVGLQACKKDSDENYTVDNQSFVTQASSSNSFEIQAGAIATQKAQNAEVKHYGEHMTTDHTAVGNEMKSLAAAKGWTKPNALLAKEQANLDKLNNTEPSSFDSEFMKIMVASHQDAITLFSNAAGNMGVYDADLRAFAGSKLPSLKTHLEGALDLQAQIK